MSVMVFNLNATGMRREVQAALGDLAEALGESATVWVPKYERPAPADSASWVSKPQFQEVEIHFDVEVHDVEELGDARARVFAALKQADPEGKTIEKATSYARELHPNSAREPDPASERAASGRGWALLGSNQ